jgi:hypothetical protein
VLGTAAAEQKPLGCAFALTHDRKDLVLLVDRKAKPKPLADALRKDGKAFIEAPSLRFGSVGLEPGDMGTLHFRVNKAEPGNAATHMTRLVKKIGYQAAVFHVQEALESEAGEDEAPEAHALDAPRDQATPPAPPPPPPGAAAPDVGALKQRLTGQVQAMSTVIAGQPALKEVLLRLAKDAQIQLGTGNLAAAAAACDTLQRALDAAQHPAGGERLREGMAEAPNATDGARVAVAKSSQVWRACRGAVQGRMAALKQAVLDAYADEPDVQAAIRPHIDRLDAALEGLDDRLDDALDAALNAAPQARAEATGHAKLIIADYIKHVAASQRLAVLDSNPFGVATELKATLTKTLTALVGLTHSMG